MPLPDFHVSEPFTLGIELEMQVVNPPGYDLSQDSSMLIDTVKNQITAGEVKHDITEVCWSWRRMFAVISTRLPGNFQRCRKSYCRQRQTIIWKFAAVARIRFRNGSVRRYAITNAINERWKTLAISSSRRPFWSACPCWLRQWR